MFCTNCNAEIADGKKFCVKCGTPAPPPEPVAIFCVKCDAQIAEGKKFCTKCGTATPPPQPQAPVTAPPQSQAAVTAPPPFVREGITHAHRETPPVREEGLGGASIPRATPTPRPPAPRDSKAQAKGSSGSGKTAGIVAAVVVALLGLTVCGHFLGFYALPFLPEQESPETSLSQPQTPEPGAGGTPGDSTPSPPSPTPPAAQMPDFFLGGEYVGEYDANGMPSGYGEWVYHNFRYEGQWENGKPNGEGVLGLLNDVGLDRQPDMNYMDAAVVNAYWIDGLAYGTISMTWFMEDGSVFTWVLEVSEGYPLTEERVWTIDRLASLNASTDWLIGGVPPWANITTNPSMSPPPPGFLGHFTDPSSLVSVPPPEPIQYLELNMDAVHLIGQTSGYIYQINGIDGFSGMGWMRPTIEFLGRGVPYPFMFYIDWNRDWEQIIRILDAGGPDVTWPDNLTIESIEGWDYDWFPDNSLQMMFSSNVPLVLDNMVAFFEMEGDLVFTPGEDAWFDSYEHDTWAASFISGQYRIYATFLERNGTIEMFRAEISYR
ncbi:MAG: zinc ribbon domain-containing protein [Oscillospiraceae bacterium]|nr:zinc ribbon domain-containing protein [Oscillospiraceae bacterium]